MTLEIVVEAAWPDQLGEIADRVELCVFEHLVLDRAAFECSILLTDDHKMRLLNREFRERDKATNVLSWPATEIHREVGKHPTRPSHGDMPFETPLGDIALGLETCRAEAEDVGFDNHVTHLILHGFLHLFGYDHVDDRDAEIMEALEILLLDRLDIPNPYAMDKNGS